MAIPANLPSWAPSSIDLSKVTAIPGGGDLGFPGASGPGYSYNGLQLSGNPDQGYYAVKPMPGGATQTVYYDTNGQANDVRGANADTGSWLDQVIKYGAMAGGALAAGGGFAGFGTTGPGAAAVGGDAGAAVGDTGAAAASGAGAADAGAGMTFDNSALVDQAASTAATNAAPQIASDASNIAAQGASGIAADAASNSPSWLNDVWNAVKPSPQSLVRTGVNMLLSGNQQNPLAAAGAPGSQQASSAPNYGNNVDQVQMPTVDASTPRTGLVGTNMGQ